jgi:hypothetical protein
MRHRQKGITFIGLLLLLALVAIPVYAGIRLLPVYLNYFKLVRTMESTAQEFKGGGDEGGIRRSLERHWSIEDITGLDYKDVEIRKDDGVVTMHAVYKDEVPYLANVALVVNFEKTVKVQ